MSSAFRPSWLRTSASTFMQTSWWKPAYLPSPSAYDMAPDASRTPTTTVPVSLIFFSVSVGCAWAAAPRTASAVMARLRASLLMVIGVFVIGLLGKDLVARRERLELERVAGGVEQEH